MKKNLKFEMSISLTSTMEEYVEWVNSLGDDEDDKEYKQFAEKSLKDKPLPYPVVSIQFHYPYDSLQVIDIEPVSTKVELIKSVLKNMSDYIKNNPAYSAPHDINDFVLELIEVFPWDKGTCAAYVVLGS